VHHKQQPEKERTTMKIKSAVGILAITGALALQGRAQNLITNGSFESPVEPANAFTMATPDGWSGGVWIVNGNGSLSESGWPTPEDGNQYDDIGNGGSGPISQTFNVPVSSQYSLTWFDNEYVGWEHSYTVSVTGNTTASYDSVSTGLWISQSLSVSLNAGENTLVFQPTGGAGDTLIDNVSLVPSFSVAPTTPIISWTNPAPIVFGTVLSSNQLNATANVAGSFAYNPTNGAVLNVGTNTLSVIFTPSDTFDYTSATDSVSLVVLPPLPLINIQKAVYLTSTNLSVGYNYQVQASSDLINWTNQGSVFTATNSNWQSANYWNVSDWNQLFFQLQLVP
jgi:hypothetical protein